ncbi:hypothetical protein MUK42_08289 [Musa troglodytarum]|uniref:Uncharacterized protein n=1 Tax=Musa troglodytarum TaxID=320322 RepID=A0A9E7ERG6_9LILI|nr:hypothetical protein MUK42_08289 [Musa troglodytarum]
MADTEAEVIASQLSSLKSINMGSVTDFQHKYMYKHLLRSSISEEQQTQRMNAQTSGNPHATIDHQLGVVGGDEPVKGREEKEEKTRKTIKKKFENTSLKENVNSALNFKVTSHRIPQNSGNSCAAIDHQLGVLVR